MKIRLLIILLVLQSCTGKVGCEDSTEVLYLRNSAYKYNCGLLSKKVERDTVNQLCREFSNMGEPVSAFISNNHLVIEIYFQDKRFYTYKEMITLAVTKNYGNVFKMRDGQYYKNDKLAESILQLMEIKDMYKDYEGGCDDR